MIYTEITPGYYFRFCDDKIYLVTSFREVHVVLGNLWNIVTLQGEESYLSESAIKYYKQV